MRLNYIPGGSTNTDGVVTIKDIVPGPVRVEARLSSERSLMREIVLSPGEMAETQFDFVPADAVIEGRVTVLGEPPAHAELELHVDTDAGSEVLRTNTKTDGSYRFGGIPSGIATMVVAARGENNSWFRRARRYDIPIASRNTTTYDVSLTGIAGVNGSVVSQKYPEVYLTVLEGQFSLEQAKAELSKGDSPISEASYVALQEDGSFTVENLEPGTYTIVGAYRSKSDWDIRDFFASATVHAENGSVAAVELVSPS
jgi:hypothetical protein